MAGGDHHISVPRDHSKGRTLIHQHWSNRCRHLPPARSARAICPDRAAQVPRIAEVDSGNGRYRRGTISSGATSSLSASRIRIASLARASNPPTSSVGSASAYPSPALLSAHPRIPPRLHLAQDEVAGAIQNAFNALNAIAGQPLLKAGNHGDSARDRRAVLQVPAFGRGQPLSSTP